MRLLTFSFLKNCKSKLIYRSSQRLLNRCPMQPQVDIRKFAADPDMVEICTSWPEGEEPTMREAVLRDMLVYPDFVSEAEEAMLLAELEPQLKRMRYEFDHWDNAIQGYRETERGAWSDDSEAVVSRVRAAARAAGAGDLLPHAHVLDLAPAGHIKPHVDAVRFCGAVIAGLCLASSAVMRLEHSGSPQLALHALLAQRSLYIMRGVARYDFTHAVLGAESSAWRGARVPRRRRVAVICRSSPPPHAQ